jgi:hypothetical protein
MLPVHLKSFDEALADREPREHRINAASMPHQGATADGSKPWKGYPSKCWGGSHHSFTYTDTS